MSDLRGGFGYRVRRKIECNENSDVVKLSENIVLFRNKIVGQHDNVFEGEVRSSVYGTRACVVKFAVISEQNAREAEILTKLGAHTNVIAIIQSGIFSDLFEECVYIALDKCHNENLRQYLANRKTAGVEYDLNQAIDFAKQMIAGVMYIHDNNVIHLDLKPSNILISQNFRLIKLADFGLSIVVKSPKSKVFHKGQFGTNGYRPIESFGDGQVSMRTDIFSLGTTLQHLLSNGNDVFGCDGHIFTNNVMNDITDTSGLLVSNPNTTEHLIKRMVSKERCRRPTIWEVFDHPCWSGKEIKCDFGYFTDDEVDDNAPVNIAEEVEENNSLSKTDDGRTGELVRRLKEMGFERKSTMVLFEDWSKQLYRFDHKTKSLTKMHKYPVQSTITMSMFTPAAAVGEYIYAFDQDTAYRLEYGDANASWEAVTAELKVHRFNFVTSSTEIFLVCQYHHTPFGPKKDEFFKHVPSSKQWVRWTLKPTATCDSQYHCNDEFLYCFGGYNVIRGPERRRINIVERVDIKTTKWSRVADLPEGRDVISAAECKGKIYTIGDDSLDQVVIPLDMYDPAVDQWTSLKSLDGALQTRFFIISIDDNLFLISSEWETDKRFPFETYDDDVMTARIHRYDIAKNEWEIFVSELKGMHIQDAVVVKMSAN